MGWTMDVVGVTKHEMGLLWKAKTPDCLIRHSFTCQAISYVFFF